ncbi:MAG: glycosyltransferase [Frondihabitans sp.]|nr:glycosyltransferase [Frondihabitans sp.]
MRALRYEAHAYFRSRPLRRSTILYEAFAGSGVLDNPEALFREILATPDMQHFEHVWVVNDRSPRHPAKIEFDDDERIRFVRRGTLAYYRALATSEYLINNATFPQEFSKRPGQVYLNTWHGTPLKTMGYDMPSGALESANTLRNFVSADFLLAQNRFMTEQMYRHAYRLDGHYRGAIIEEGYPRVDRQDVTSNERIQTRRRIDQQGMHLGHRRIVLYAPTWKGTTFGDPTDDVATLLDQVRTLQAALGDDHVVLLKTHQIVERFSRANTELRRILVPGDIPTNVMLGITDVLVTDYSSIFFDFLATGRPLVFFTPDADAYTSTRGTYFRDDELPGPVRSSIADVAADILEQGDPDEARKHAMVRNDWQARYASDAIGTSAKRVIDVVFRGYRDGYRVRDVSASDRTSILIHLGALWSNGITSSALNLLEALPDDRFDVSVVYNRTASGQLIVNQARIASTARQFAREGGMNGSKVEHLRRRMFERLLRPTAHHDDRRQRALWDDEWLRCFGSSTFDHVIDFSGYGPFWATFLLHAPGSQTAIWLHNDMVAEVDRLVGGKPTMKHTLPAVFSLYGQYDSLVSVSGSLAAVNSRRLADYLLWPPVIESAHNLLDPARDAERARVKLLETPFPVEEGEEPAVPEWATRLDSKGDTAWFVTVGRFSPEKNQARLIRAFALVHADTPRARLLIIGHGGLRDSLQAQIDELGLHDVAFIDGPLGNPLPAMKASDCFVLSSRYEGQPMVLLEAAALNLPIVSVDFETVHDVLPDSGIHVVEQTDDALAEGMRAYLRGAVAPASLDPVAYNSEALAEFIAATGLSAALAPVGKQPAVASPHRTHLRA